MRGKEGAGGGEVCRHIPEDKTPYQKRSNDPECPFFQFLPKEKNTRYNLRNTSVSVPRIYTDRFKNVFSNRIIFRYDM